MSSSKAGLIFLKPPGCGANITERLRVYPRAVLEDFMVIVESLIKSPLAWSIGGVGVIAIALIGVDYLRQPTEPSPSAAITLNTVETSLPWQQGKALGWQAAVAAQTAHTQADWQGVADLWAQAIALLESISEGEADSLQAQAKVEEYRANQAIAAQRQANAPSGSREGRPPAIADLSRALAAADTAFTFAPGPAPNTLVGQSADGLATVELTSRRATLVLPRSPQGELTMAQVVYVQQFLAVVDPETAVQPWLVEGLRQVQGDRPPTPPPHATVSLSASPTAVSVTVDTAREN